MIVHLPTSAGFKAVQVQQCRCFSWPSVDSEDTYLSMQCPMTAGHSLRRSLHTQLRPAMPPGCTLHATPGKKPTILEQHVL
eukprot:Skav235217  [mRNA]  locus=scaffold3995:70879:71728:+ [translate_table: standard]